jgi:hypothetical protein
MRQTPVRRFVIKTKRLYFAFDAEHRSRVAGICLMDVCSQMLGIVASNKRKVTYNIYFVVTSNEHSDSGTA